MSAERVSIDLFFLEFFSFFFVDQYLQKYLASILQIFKDGCSNIFVSTLTVFLIVSSQEFNSQLQVFNQVWIEYFRLFCKYWIRMSSLGVAIGQTFIGLLINTLSVQLSQSYFQLVLEISLNLFLLAIHKSLEVPQVSIKKNFKLITYDQDRTICILFLLYYCQQKLIWS